MVVILDSHMEVNDFWLEPLLNILTNKPGGIAVPLIHMMYEADYATQGSKLVEPYIVQPRKGHSHLSLINYRRVKDKTERRRWEPIPSPGVMGGGLAAYRSTLLEYYPVSIVNSSWGVENNRLSFRAWMCGEGVWVSPCSQVLHPNGNDVSLNRYFKGKWDMFGVVIHESVAEILNFVDNEVDKEKLLFKVSSLIKDHAKIKTISNEIRNSFNPVEQQCKSYKWYLNEVYASYISWERDQFDHVGEVRSLHDPNTCLEVLDRKLELYSCRGTQLELLDTHTVGFTKNQDVRSGNLDGECWDTASPHEEGGEIKMYMCHVTPVGGETAYGSQRFVYDEKSKKIIHLPSGRCLEFVSGSERARPLLMKCSVEKIQQKWDIIDSAWF